MKRSTRKGLLGDKKKSYNGRDYPEMEIRVEEDGGDSSDGITGRKDERKNKVDAVELC